MKIIFKIAAILFVFANSFAYANNLSAKVDEFAHLNHEIAKWSEEAAAADDAAKEKINHEIKELKSAKNSILAAFAPLLNDENLSAEFFASLRAKSGAAGALEREFYGCLRDLHEAFLAGGSSEGDLRARIDAAIAKIKALGAGAAAVGAGAQLAGTPANSSARAGFSEASGEVENGAVNSSGRPANSQASGGLTAAGDLAANSRNLTNQPVPQTAQRPAALSEFAAANSSARGANSQASGEGVFARSHGRFSGSSAKILLDDPRGLSTQNFRSQPQKSPHDPVAKTNFEDAAANSSARVQKTEASGEAATSAATAAAPSATPPAILAESLTEMLTYLRLNVQIFKGNALLSAARMSALIAAINGALPGWITEWLNVGKLALCALIFAVVFYSFRRLILRALAAICARLLPEAEREHNEHFFARLRRPVVALFFVYTLRLCALVFFYPAPIAPAALRAFALANVVLAAWVIISVFNGYGMLFITRAAAKTERRDAVNLMIKIANYFIIAIAALAGAAALGFDVSAIIASLGIGGLAVALAAKDIIANFFASVMLHFDNSFSQGDWVKIGEIEGTVVEIGMRKTAVRTFDNSLVFVPNSQIMASPVRNWSRRKLGRKIGLSIGLEYSCSAEQVSQIIADIRAMLAAHPGIAQPAQDNYAASAQCGRRERVSMVSLDDLDGYKNTQFVYLDEFAASSIDIYVYCFSKSIIWGEFLRVKEDVMLQIMRIVEANGAGFAFPSQSVYIEKMPSRGE